MNPAFIASSTKTNVGKRLVGIKIVFLPHNDNSVWVVDVPYVTIIS